MATNTICKVEKLIQIFDKKIDYSSFILSTWVKNCHCKYPTNIEYIRNIRKYYIFREKSISIHQILPIINVVNQANDHFKLLCFGFIRQFNTSHTIPIDIIDLIDMICAVKCISHLRQEGLALLTDILTTDKYITINTVKILTDNGIIELIHKSFKKVLSFHVKSTALYALYNISNIIPKFKHTILKCHILKCTKFLHVVLSTTIPPTKQIIDSDIISLLIILAKLNKYPELQYASVGALLNIAAGPTECTTHIIQHNAHKLLITLLESPLYELKEQSMWGLSNIAGDGQQSKDLLLNSGILRHIFNICTSKFDKQYVSNFTNSDRI
eukprot:348453_1